MSRRSKKQGRPQVQRDPATYLPRLERTRQAMLEAAERWDVDRKDHDVMIMAACLRLLLHDGLLAKVLNVRRRLSFADTATPRPEIPGIGPVHRIGSGGLVLLEMGHESSQLVPLCQVKPPFTIPVRWARFETWWKKATPIRQNDLEVSREFLVYETANTDGLHIDAELDADYAALSSIVEGVTLTDRNGNVRHLEGAAAASIRQIAWEVERTLVVGLATLRLEELASQEAPTSTDG